MNRHVLTLLIVAAALTGCAHNHRTGSVLHLEEDGTAHVCLSGKTEPGEHLSVYDVACATHIVSSATRARPVTTCQKTLLGGARVLEVNDGDFSRIEPEGGMVLRKGQIVELKR